jgi:hypothetical protein
MAPYSWVDVWHLPHKVRNMVRRGYLLKVYNDKKILRARCKTGDELENDKLDIMHPVGYVAHVKPSEKTELITMDVGGDSSRRVIAWIVGDREYHPQPDEGEAFYYAPGEKKQFLRIKKKRDQQQRQGRAADEDSSGNKDSGRESGMHWDGLEERVTGTTKSSFQNNADKGQGFSTEQGSFEINAGQNTQFAASKHVRKGPTYRDGDTFTNGTEHAADHVAGGGATITGGMTTFAAAFDDQNNNHPDGTKPWSAQGKAGNVSLLQTAASLGGLSAAFGSFSQQQQQQNQQTNDQLADLERRVTALEQKVG